MTLYLEPDGLLTGAAAERALRAGDAARLAGGPVAFTHVERIERAAGAGSSVERLSLAAVRRRAATQPEMAVLLDRLTAGRAEFAGLTMAADAGPRLMGIVNVTPDSFSDGGAFLDPPRAIDHARALIEDGADIIDVGGESTRPGAEPVDAETELARVMPVVEALTGGVVPVSIDTRRASVMAAATGAGATIVNDVSALAGDPGSLAVVAASDAGVVLMHMAGGPQTMQDDPVYDDVALDVFDALAARIAACEAAGIDRRRICVDPGIGFGKTVAHNLVLLDRLALFQGLGCAVMVGASRKSFLSRIAAAVPSGDRLGGSLAAALAAQTRGCQIVRVHDVAQTRQAVLAASCIAAAR